MAIITRTGIDAIPTGESYDNFEVEGIANEALGSLPEPPEALPAIEAVQTYELGSEDSTETLAVRRAKRLIAVTAGNAKWEVPSEDGTFFDFHIMAAQAQTATGNAGVVSADAMPPYIRLTDTSSSANTVTIYARF